MENRNENAISRRSISGAAMKSLRKFHKRKTEALTRRIKGYSLLLHREKNPQERRKIARCIVEWRQEQAALFTGWMRSEVRNQLKEEMPTYVRMQDDLLRKDNEVEEKYRQAGLRIARLKASM